MRFTVVSRKSWSAGGPVSTTDAWLLGTYLPSWPYYALLRM